MSTDKEKLAGISNCLICLDVVLRCKVSTIDDVKSIVRQIKDIINDPNTTVKENK